MTYRQLLVLRHRIAARANHGWQDFSALAGNALSRTDIDVLRSAMIRSSWEPSQCVGDELCEGDNAGKAALALFTRAGYCDLAADVRPWLIGYQDPGDQIYTTGPHVLHMCVNEVKDGNALRVLFEAAESGNFDVALNLSRAIADSEDDVLDLLKSSRKQQVGSLLDRARVQSNVRQLWILKTFIQEDEVRDFLASSAAAGELYGLLSLLFRGDVLRWSLFDKIRIRDADELDMFVNAMVENVARGADPDYLSKAPALGAFSVADIIADGLAVINENI